LTIIRRLGAHCAVAAVIAAGCTGDSAGPSGVAPVAGSWQFAGQQTGSATIAIAGALVLVSQTTTTYTGTIDVVQSAPGVGSVRLAGPVSGRMVSASSVDFSSTVAGAQRQHVGTLVADTMAGTWVEISALGGISGSGTFRAVRTGR
jgi:hypothetical protein